MKPIIYMPALNEEQHIRALLVALPARLQGIDSIEYLVVDDGSTDQSVTLRQRITVLKRYNVRYLLTADAGLVDYYAVQPGFVGPRKIAGYWLIESLESGR
jgi:glycosyltransferase involved in cell wall biosynthesis